MSKNKLLLLLVLHLFIVVYVFYNASSKYTVISIPVNVFYTILFVLILLCVNGQCYFP